MGVSTELYIADYPLLSIRNDVSPTVMTIFRETDKRIYKRIYGERNPLPEGQDIDSDEIQTAYEYTATVGNIKDRLEIMGFYLGRVVDEFYEGITNEIASLQEMIDSSPEDGSHDSLIEDWTEDLNLLSSTKFEGWVDAFAYIIQHGLQPGRSDGELTQEESSLVRYILREDDVDTIYNFPHTDIRCLIRAFIEACPDDILLSQDITELVEAEFYGQDDAVCELSLDELTRDYPINEKIIVLTEGSMDVFILKESLAILYPHLADYYSFMDFGLSNAAGGASFLVSTIKAFIGSGIRNRVIGLFDNDTAAKASIRAFDKTKIPDNIVILHYPELELAKRYPTIGPSGVSELDINGLAGSIELYLGTDVLTVNVQLTPVQWKGYDAGVGQYQGEILNKKALQDAFFEKVKRCKSDPSLVAEADWEPMRLLLEEMFQAFD